MNQTVKIKIKELQNEWVQLIPLSENDFESLFAVASDPLLWEQHPQKDRWKPAVFAMFFKEALANQMAFVIKHKISGNIIGTSRFYDCDLEKKSIAIGYTFIARAYWGTSINAAVKQLMIDEAFQQFDRIIFHIDHLNFRSQKATEKLGAIKTAEVERTYPNEPKSINFEYTLFKSAI